MMFGVPEKHHPKTGEPTAPFGRCWYNIYIYISLGFQIPCEDVFGPQKPTQKTKPEQVFGRLGYVHHNNDKVFEF